jgi:tetratricopeptide (TPR) repeat protein
MATDYHSLLARAIGTLDSNTSEARHSVYERARQMVERHLRTSRGMSDADIKAERSALEDAIWQIELETEEKSASRGRSTGGATVSERPAPRLSKAFIAVLAVCAVLGIGIGGWFFLRGGASLNGLVIDNFGKPLDGVDVSIVNTGFHGVTDKNGRYRLEYIPGRFEVRYNKREHAEISLALEPATAASFPVKDIVLHRIPPRPDVWLVGDNDYVTLNRCRTRQEAIGNEGFRHVLLEGRPTIIKLSPASFRFVDTNTPQGGFAITPSIFKLYDDKEFYRMKIGFLGPTGYTRVEPDVYSIGPPAVPFGRWSSAELSAGTYIYIGRWQGPGGGVQPDNDSPCYIFRAIESANDLVQSGIAHIEKYELDAAIADLDTAISIDPRLVSGFFNRGRARQIKGDDDKAISDFSEALRLDPTNHKSLTERARIWFKRKEFDRAITDATDAFKINPDDGDALSVRAFAYGGKNDADNTIRDLTDMLRIDPEKYSYALIERASLWEAKNAYDQAIADLTLLIANSNSPGLLVRRGRAYIRKGDALSGLRDADEAVRLAEDSADGYQIRGEALRALRRPNEAIPEYRLALRLVTEDSKKEEIRSALRELGASDNAPTVGVDELLKSAEEWLRKGELDRAIADANQASLVQPRSARVFLFRASVWASKGDNNRALSDYSKALEFSPKNVNAYLSRARYYLRRKDATRGLADLNEAIRLSPKSGNLFVSRSIAWLIKGDRAQAESDFREAHQLSPNLNFQQNGLTSRGQEFLQLGYADNAIADYEEAIKQNAKNVLAVVLLYNAWEKTASVDRGVEFFAGRIRQKPDDYYAYRGRARLLLRKGDPTSALRDIEEAVRINSQAYDLFQAKGDILKALGRRPDAVESYRAALRLIEPQYANLRPPIEAAIKELGASP